MPPQKGTKMKNINNLLTSALGDVAPIVISEKDIATQLTREISRLGIIRFDGQTSYLKVSTHWQKISRTDLLIVIRNLISSNDRTSVKSTHIAEVAKRLSEDMSLRIDIEAAFWKQ